MNQEPMPCPYAWIKQSGAILFAVVCLALPGSFAQAGWFVDAEKYHVSAHGQLSCQDCHSDIAEKPRHPDPSHVGKRLTDFFKPQQCLDCHEGVAADMADNQHGGRTIDPAESYENCLSCHNPHQRLVFTAGTETIDAQKSVPRECDACHERQTALPAFADEDEACMACHSLPGTDNPDAVGIITQRCFHCHANSGTETQKISGQSIALIDPQTYRETPHSHLSCTECHLQAAAFEHAQQEDVTCRQCHLPHDEATAHDAHASVACQTCHLPGVEPFRDDGSGRILGQKERRLNTPLGLHRMIVPEGETACRRCHTRGNPIGASAMVLPPKSVLCMPCHTATLSFGDAITVVSLIVFCLGLGMSLLLIFSVSPGKKGPAGLAGKTTGSETERGSTSPRPNRVRIVHEIILNVLFQKRLFERSPARWFIHGLLFFPMALRFLWGIVALSGSLWRPQWQWVWQMVDKNNGTTAFFFDLTGVMILSGVLLALYRHFSAPVDRMKGLPRRSCLALVLLGGIVVTGFVLEGMRIAMTGATGSAAYALVGFRLSTLFQDPEVLSHVYGYGWYVHAVLTGAFIAFLPFSRLMHMILSPVVLALNAITGHDRN